MLQVTVIGAKARGLISRYTKPNNAGRDTIPGERSSSTPTSTSHLTHTFSTTPSKHLGYTLSTMPSGVQKSSGKSQGGNLKQISLMSFFGKASTTTATSSSSTPTLKSKAATASSATKSIAKTRSKIDTSSEDVQPESEDEPTTPPKKASLSSVVGSAKYTHSSNGVDSAMETPPTSDPVDVEMMSVDEDDEDEKKSPVKAVSH